MFKFFKQNHKIENNLYSKILFLSRNKIFYSDFGVLDTFQNRINLIFFHFSFLFNKGKINDTDKIHKIFDQKMFNFIFNRIELNMREIGYGDVTVNKNMKFLVKTFYNILLDFKKYHSKKISDKNVLFIKYLTIQKSNKTIDNNGLTKYFNKYQSFCFDLSLDSVIKGELKFTYK